MLVVGVRVVYTCHDDHTLCNGCKEELVTTKFPPISLVSGISHHSSLRPSIYAGAGLHWKCGEKTFPMVELRKNPKTPSTDTFLPAALLA